MNEFSAVEAAGMRISADSHMGEPLNLWVENLPVRFRDRAMRWPNLREFETNHHLRAGAWDPYARLKDLAIDGTSAEVLFPTQGVPAWALQDLELQEAHIRVYNDFMIDFCRVAPHRFWGLAMISLWNIERAVAELERCRNEGLRGAAIWIAPPARLPYSEDHYEAFWDAAQAMNVPLAMHINARAEAVPSVVGKPVTRTLHSINGHKFDAMSSLGHLIASGVMERYPRLKFLVAEIGCGWIPFWLQEFDHYQQARNPLRLKPSEYFSRQVFSTFISDPVGGYLLRDYGENTFLWSSDYPHPACTWPDSGVVIEEDLGHLSTSVREKIVWRNVAGVFSNGEPAVAADPPAGRAGIEEWLRTHPGFGATSRLKIA
ncbi:MAG TPA: amidohydrolase family protein [Dehalococcoidia bacterium]|nr:amidohydrolase family protein [Dehalococcoidia bacterium]